MTLVHAYWKNIVLVVVLFNFPCGGHMEFTWAFVPPFPQFPFRRLWLKGLWIGKLVPHFVAKAELKLKQNILRHPFWYVNSKRKVSNNSINWKHSVIGFFKVAIGFHIMAIKSQSHTLIAEVYMYCSGRTLFWTKLDHHFGVYLITMCSNVCFGFYSDTKHRGTYGSFNKHSLQRLF